MSLPKTIERAASQAVWSVGDEATDILASIGNTPLLRLRCASMRLPPGVRILGKAEWFNPGGSVKDRPALRMVQEAERSGALRRGKVIIDSTSGNTGVALAMIGAAKGYPVELVMPANVSEERKRIARAYGATLILSDPLEGSDGAIREVQRRVAAVPERYFFVDQYNNPANWQAHFDTTGAEIWQQTGGQITHLVAGLGTSGTLMGTGRRLKVYNPAVQVVAVQPPDGFQVIEGLKHMATAIVPGIYDPAFPDVQVTAMAEETWEMTQRLAREEGIFVGFSAGAALHAACQIARDLREAVIVAILPDSGSRYLSLDIWK
ncbi:MAG: cysteine synthase [Anaerolineae bacterium]|nr:cysteine synthase [Anaerolineae bacterium]